MQQENGGCKKRLKGKEQLSTLASLYDDHELRLDLLPYFSVHMDTLEGVWDSIMVDSSLHIGVSLDNVRSGLSDSSKVFPHLSILPSPRHLPGVEDLAASPLHPSGRG